MATSPERTQEKPASAHAEVSICPQSDALRGGLKKLSKTSAGRWRTSKNACGRVENNRLAERRFAKKRGVEPSQRKHRSKCPKAGAETKS